MGWEEFGGREAKFLLLNRVCDRRTMNDWKLVGKDFKNWTNLLGGQALGQMFHES